MERVDFVRNFVRLCVCLVLVVYWVLSGTELTKNNCYRGEIKYDEVVKVIK